MIIDWTFGHCSLIILARFQRKQYLSVAGIARQQITTQMLLSLHHPGRCPAINFYSLRFRTRRKAANIWQRCSYRSSHDAKAVRRKQIPISGSLNLRRHSSTITAKNLLIDSLPPVNRYGDTFRRLRGDGDLHR
jgi:hypothetical protein